jgi:hypothetical protein
MITVGIISKPEHTRGLKAALAKTGKYTPVLLGADPGRVSVPTAVEAVVCRMRSVSHDAGDVALSLHRVRADLPVIFTNGSSRAIQQLNEIFYPNTEEPMNTIQGLRWLTDNFFFAPGMRRMSKDQCLTLYRMVADRAGAHKLIQPTEWTLVEEALDGIYRTKLTSTQTACSEIRLAARMPSGLPPRLIERSFHTVIEPNRKRSKFQKVTYYCMFSLSRPWSHAMAKEGVLEQCWADLTGHEVFSDVDEANAHCRFLLEQEKLTEAERALAAKQEAQLVAAVAANDQSQTIRGVERAAEATGESTYNVKQCLALLKAMKGAFDSSPFAETWSLLCPTREETSFGTPPWTWRDPEHVRQFVKVMETLRHADAFDCWLRAAASWKVLEIDCMETLEGWGYPVEWPEESVGIAIRDAIRADKPAPAPVPVPALVPAPEPSDTELQTLIGMVKDALRRAGKVEYVLDGVHMSCMPVHWSSPWHACASDPWQGEPPGEASTQLSAVTCPDCLNSEQFTQAKWILNNCGDEQ